MPSPICTINGSATPANVAASATVNGALVSSAGVNFWSLQAISTDETTSAATVNGTLSVNFVAKTFSFTAPSALGSAVIFKSTVGVNSLGVDANGVVQPSYSTTFKVNVLAANGNAVMALNEQFEGNPSAGWVSVVNGPARTASGGGGGGGGTTTSGSFVEPAFGSTQAVALADATVVAKGQPATINGINYLVTNIAGSVVTFLNADANNPTGATIVAGAKVAFGGSNVSLASVAPLKGQVLRVDSTTGKLTPVGHKACINAAQANPVGDGTTDDWAALQSVLDSVGVGQSIDVIIPRNATNFTPLGGANTGTWYCISQPLVMNDKFTATSFDTLGNSCTRLRGDNRECVGIIGQWQSNTVNPTWLGPLLIIGDATDTTPPVYTTDSGMTCLVGGVAANAPYINFSEFDIGNINSYTSMCVEFWYNRLTDPGAGSAAALFSSYGNLLNLETHSAMGVRRENFGGGVQVRGFLTTDSGAGTTTTGASFTMPAKRTAYVTLQVASTTGMVAGRWLTFPTQGYVEVVSVTDGTHVVVMNPGPGTNAAPGTVIASGVTVKIEGTVTVATATGHDLNASTLQHVALDYDGTNLRLWINGVQTLNNLSGGTADTGMTAALTGAVIQKWYEETTAVVGVFGAWPENGGIQYGNPACHFGKTRISNTSRYTSAFTPSAASVTCDGFAPAYIDFALATPASNGFSSRISLQGFIIARSGGNASQRTRTNVPVWLHSHTTNVPYTTGAQVSDLMFYGMGRGIELNSCLQSYLRDLRFHNFQQGLDFINFSYGAVYERLDFIGLGGLGTGQIGCHSWDIRHGGGSQFMTHGDGIATNGCATQWHLVNQFNGAEIRSCFLTGNARGIFAFVGGTSVCTMRGVVVDDENGSSDYSVVLCSSITGLRAEGGSLYNANPGCPVFKVGACAVLEVTTEDYGGSPQPMFSFGSGQNAGGVVRFNGVNGASTTAVIDPLHPGHVVVPAQEMTGVKTFTFPSDANYSMRQDNGECFWREYLIAAGVVTLDHRVITWPSNPGKIYEGRNNNTKIVDLATASGAAVVPVAAGATFKVQDQATGMVPL